MSETTDEKPKSNLSYADIKKRLRETIPEDMISLKPTGRGEDARKIRYVNVTDVKDMLDTRVGSEHWDATFVSQIVAGDTYICWVKIRIHAFDGIFDQDGVGDENFPVKGYGSVGTNAYAQAFRRAAEGHGLARELWRGELSEEQRNAPSTPAQIEALHQQMTRLKREEEAAVRYYTNNRVDLFGEMTQEEASIAMTSLAKIKTPAAPEDAAPAKKNGGKK